MKKLLSLPPNLANCFRNLRPDLAGDCFCTHDPIGRKLGSGGGTTWLLESCRKAENPDMAFDEWLSQEKRILLHAGGQSRRIPAYAPSGKILTPIPVFRWASGQCLNQTLLDLQLPLFEKILEAAPSSLHTLVASGDVMIRTTGQLQPIPEADVVCYGLWVNPELARNHGVFIMDRNRPTCLNRMLQKPSPIELSMLSSEYFFLMDVGVWLLSDRAVRCLRRKSAGDNEVTAYDLYGQFGCALGEQPSLPDDELSDLSVAILPLPDGEFYHYGTSAELISSTTAIQNLVKDQRYILQRDIKQQSSVFTQNAEIENTFTDANHDIWVENSRVLGWKLTARNIVTGIPQNDWRITLDEGRCVDMVPIGDAAYALRPYGFTDKFRGALDADDTSFMERSVVQWLSHHHLKSSDFSGAEDLQTANLFPVSDNLELLRRVLLWMLSDEPTEDLSSDYLHCERLSADRISDIANLPRLVAQRHALCTRNVGQMARNWRKSVFYQVNLSHAARIFSDNDLQMPDPIPSEAPLLTRARDAMFRSEYARFAGKDGAEAEKQAFGLLREGLVGTLRHAPVVPQMSVYADQIVWGRSAVRIDVAGGWTDTPPYSLSAGGNVVNFAVELNGQQPLQVYVRPSKERAIICRSIDLGAMERIESYEELQQFNKVGSPFSIPKAALALAGFSPAFCGQTYSSLKEQLDAFGCGLEITLLSAIPAGSGLGTSSVLAATVLGALSDFCGLAWDKQEIGLRTLVLEQLLTTGGGWQDQYGGILPGIKLLQTERGFCQTPVTRWLPDTLFVGEDYKACHLLYYTGLTRTAKNVLTEIVRGMFLNRTKTLALLGEMKEHALQMQGEIQRGDFVKYGRLVRKTWEQNKLLDSGTEPEVIAALCKRIDDWCLGYKLPGAGGGGYLYMVAKDAEAARRIRYELQEHPLMSNARFVEMSLSREGLQVSRS